MQKVRKPSMIRQQLPASNPTPRQGRASLRPMSPNQGAYSVRRTYLSIRMQMKSKTGPLRACSRRGPWQMT